MVQSVVVVGGGVMGFTSALRLLESKQVKEVTLIADKFAGITSKSSPAVFRPDWLGDTPPEKVVRWGLETRKHLSQVYRSEEGGSDQGGVTHTDHLEIYREEAGEDACRKSNVLSKVMSGFRAMTEAELELHFPQASGGWHYSSFMIEGSRYVEYIRRRAVAMGLRVIEGKVTPFIASCAALCCPRPFADT